MTDNFLHSTYEALRANSVLQSEILARICVRPPYFALENVHLVDDILVANAKAELPPGPALGPMRPGDLSRHGAIAGLCALALRQRDDQRRYYLATRADFTGYLSGAPYGAVLRFQAEVTEFGKRNARAFITAYHEQERVATLDVEYTILNTMVFERLYAFRRQPTPAAVRLEPEIIRDVEWRGNTGVYRIGALPVSLCTGHFENYPAAPVALLMDGLAQIAERFVSGPSYIASGQIEATSLCWAGEEVSLSMTKLSGDLRETVLQGFVESGGATAAEMNLLLRH